MGKVLASNLIQIDWVTYNIITITTYAGIRPSKCPNLHSKQWLLLLRLLQFIYVSYSISFDKVIDGKKYEIVFPPDDTWYSTPKIIWLSFSEHNNKSGPENMMCTNVESYLLTNKTQLPLALFCKSKMSFPITLSRQKWTTADH